MRDEPMFDHIHSWRFHTMLERMKERTREAQAKAWWQMRLRHRKAALRSGTR